MLIRFKDKEFYTNDPLTVLITATVLYCSIRKLPIKFNEIEGESFNVCTKEWDNYMIIKFVNHLKRYYSELSKARTPLAVALKKEIIISFNPNREVTKFE